MWRLSPVHFSVLPGPIVDFAPREIRSSIVSAQVVRMLAREKSGRFSTTRTRKPSNASSTAARSPVGPAPHTRTSFKSERAGAGELRRNLFSSRTFATTCVLLRRAVSRSWNSFFCLKFKLRKNFCEGGENAASNSGRPRALSGRQSRAERRTSKVLETVATSFAARKAS